MAFEKKINTRIVLKHDSLENWNKASLVLKEGEIALAKVGSASNGTYETPTYLMKVGDGTSAFSALKWVAASAADVYDWAKQKELPVEMSGEGNAVTSVSWDASANKIVVTRGASFDAAGTADKLNTAMNARVAELEKAVGEGGSVGSQIDAKINLLDFKKVTAAQGQIIDSVEQVDGKVAATVRNLVADDIPTLTVSKISDFDSSIKAYKYATKTEAQGYADGKDSAISAAQSAAEVAQTKADTADQHAVDAQTRVGVIEGDYLKKTDREALEQADANLVQADAKQVERIATLEETIKGVSGAMHFKGVKLSVPEGEALKSYADGDVVIVGEKEYVFSEKAFHEFGDVSAEGDRIGILEGEMDAAQASITTLTGKGEGSVAKALVDAKAYTDTLANGQVKTNTGAIATNAGNIAKNTEAIEAINNVSTGILAKAKEHANGLDTAMNGRVADIEGKVSGWDSAAAKANSALQESSISEGAVAGAISVGSKSVAVHGLGTAAQKNVEFFATSAQGAKADSAVQKIAEGTANGTIKVDGSDVNVHGLGSAAYTASGAYATAEQGKKADTALQTKDLEALNGAMHNHANKGVLDGISAEKVSAWDGAVTKAGTALQEVVSPVESGLKVSNKNSVAFDPDAIFVFDCGTSTTVVDPVK